MFLVIYQRLPNLQGRGEEEDGLQGEEIQFGKCLFEEGVTVKERVSIDLYIPRSGLETREKRNVKENVES